MSYTDMYGGAARAALRLHRSLITYGIKSRMKVRWKQSNDPTIDGPAGNIRNTAGYLRPWLTKNLFRLQKTTNTNYHTGNFLPSNWSGKINHGAYDVINLHWVSGETLSIEDIGRIEKPVIWTLHDMWPFCGAEHYADCSNIARWKGGYHKSNKPADDTGIDINKFIWKRKQNSWRKPMNIVSPSNWLAECALESMLFKDMPVSVIPNVLDTSVFQPLNRAFCRDALGLPSDKKIILFGSIGATKDARKGFDLLLDALNILALNIDTEGVMNVVFGQNQDVEKQKPAFMTRWFGHVFDDIILCLLYNAADVMVVPSRQENLPQTATEALACACPVVAFNCTGLPDVVDHSKNGYLARAYDPEDLAEGISWILENSDRRDMLGQSGRKKALEKWAPEIVVPQYLSVYERAQTS